MTDTQVEQIARVIYESRNGAGRKPWSLRPHAHRAPYLEDARAILPFITAAHEAGRLEGAAEMRERAAALARTFDVERWVYDGNGTPCPSRSGEKIANRLAALPLPTPPQEG